MILAMTSTIIPIINETLKAINFIAFIYYIKESKCNCLLLLWANSDRMIEAGFTPKLSIITRSPREYNLLLFCCICWKILCGEYWIKRNLIFARVIQIQNRFPSWLDTLYNDRQQHSRQTDSMTEKHVSVYAMII